MARRASGEARAEPFAVRFGGAHRPILARIVAARSARGLEEVEAAARAAYLCALDLAGNAGERRFLLRRLEAVSGER
jgi:predicted RNA polymerase sigma factor